MKWGKCKKIGAAVLALILVGTLLLPITEPYWETLRDVVVNMQEDVDFARPESYESVHEAGVDVDESVNQGEEDNTWDDNAYEDQPQNYYPGVQEKFEEMGFQMEQNTIRTQATGRVTCTMVCRPMSSIP